MTVAELIERLGRYPADADVHIVHHQGMDALESEDITSLREYAADLCREFVDVIEADVTEDEMVATYIEMGGPQLIVLEAGGD